jgi:hypothetical protein
MGLEPTTPSLGSGKGEPIQHESSGSVKSGVLPHVAKPRDLDTPGLKAVPKIRLVGVAKITVAYGPKYKGIRVGGAAVRRLAS